ncbi:MAG: peptidylprolyl isomerase [Planctomycetes bacterium]|nr:peptidylprolyl isomerase [Planctomycetota bacterium]
MTRSSVYAPLLLASLAPSARGQSPDDVLARYVLDGKPAAVTRTDVALEMAFHLRRRDRGQEAIALLVDATLTRRAAEQKGLMPTRPEVEQFWHTLQDQLRAAGQNPASFAAVRNTNPDQWLADLAVQMAQERLVRAELGLGKEEAVGPDMLKLWLQEQRRLRRVVVDQDALPLGACAQVDDTTLPLADLGLLLLRTAEDAERERFVRQVVYLQAIEALGRARGVQVGEADLEASIAARRAEAARDPRYAGATFEQLLQGQGMTVAALRELRVFRAQVLLDKLALVLWPDADLQAELRRDRQTVLDLVGPRRHLGVIFVRALVDPNDLVPRDFAAATAHLQQVRERLDRETFANVAAIESEDNATKPRGGDTGWHRRKSGQLPEPVLAAAFALPAGEVSAPVRSEEGVWLVKVLEVDPDPSDVRLVEQLRRYKALELQQQVLRDAQIELVTAPPAGPK